MRFIRLKRPQTQLATMIDQVEGKLDLALNSIPEWSNGNLASENVRIAELRSTWRDKADRLRELDALLARPSFVADTFFVAEPAATEELTPPRSPNDSHEQSRQQNLAQLRSVRNGMYQDLITATVGTARATSVAGVRCRR